MHVICTAGHVDHGKSTLVRALTGMEPDRFEEERRRGLTIDLGFAWCDLPIGDDRPPATLAFVDLPGHQRFVSNMLAGAGSIALALLVVSAEEGWMPQSQEHLEILDLLGVERGIVVITKADLVDAETLEFAIELTRDEVAGTTLDGAPVLAVSAETGVNIDVLREELARLLAIVEAEPDDERPRLWVDRSFSVRGAGTVVTGTLRGGRFNVDDEVEILPGKLAARVRGMQSLGEGIETAEPGGRVAVNLSGVPREAVERGHVVVRPDQWLAGPAFEAVARALPGRTIDRRGDWHLHVGSGEWPATIIPVLSTSIDEHRDGYVRVELHGEASLEPGDRFVLRESGRRRTIGGGIVLDAAPPGRARGLEERLQRSESLERRQQALLAGDRVALLVEHARNHGSVADRDATAVGGLSRGQRSGLEEDARLERLGSAWIDPDDAAEWRARVVEAVETYHLEHPVERSAPKDVAMRCAQRAGCPTSLAAPLVAALTTEGLLVAEGTGVRVPGHEVQLDAEASAARASLLEALDVSDFSPPPLSEVTAASGATPALIRELEASGELFRVENDLAFSATMIDQAHAMLKDAYVAEGALAAGRAKEVLGTTRKYAMPLLELLDRLDRTRRDGDVRHVL